VEDEFDRYKDHPDGNFVSKSKLNSNSPADGNFKKSVCDGSTGENMKKIGSLLVLAIALSGCSHLLSQKQAELAPSRETLGLGETLTLPAQLRTTTIKKKPGDFISCSEPAPDVALSDTFKLITGITADVAQTASSAASAASSSTSSTGKRTFNNELQSNTTALELAGRTQTVLLAREFLFRTCEAASNGWLDSKAVVMAHRGALDQITGMVAADRQKAETAGVLAAASVSIQLDSKALLNAGSVLRDTVGSVCLKSFEECLSKAGSNEKDKEVCRATFARCVK
jgi:hypothetical protein